MNANRRRQLGFSLIESLATVAISGVLLGAGVPGFAQLIAENRLSTEVNSYVVQLNLARSEAVKQGNPAILCPSIDGLQCLGEPQWHRGYILFVDRNGNQARDADEPILRHVQGKAQAPVTIASSQSRHLVRFQSDGSTGGSNLTVTFCDAGGHGKPRAVVVSNVGRPRVTDKTAAGDALTCG